MADKFFPAIEVKSVYTEEYVKGGGDQVLENDEITPKAIKETFQGEAKLIYVMEVLASSRPSAKAKASAFVRTKNFFEPSRTEFIQTKKLADEEVGVGPLLKKYMLTVGIEK